MSQRFGPVRRERARWVAQPALGDLRANRIIDSAVDILARVVSTQGPVRPETLREEISPSLSDIVGKALSNSWPKV